MATIETQSFFFFFALQQVGEGGFEPTFCYMGEHSNAIETQGS